MKCTKFTLFVCSAMTTFSLLVVGCSKSNNSTPPTGMSTAVNGKAYTDKGTNVVSANGGLGLFYTISSGGIVGGDTAALVMTIGTPIVLNKKVLTDSDAIASLDYIVIKNGAPFADYTADFHSGDSIYITVTSLDTVNHKITGTFSGKVAIDHAAVNQPDSVVFTSGTFNSSYQ